jgi:hypothetical protein
MAERRRTLEWAGVVIAAATLGVTIWYGAPSGGSGGGNGNSPGSSTSGPTTPATAGPSSTDRPPVGGRHTARLGDGGSVDLDQATTALGLHPSGTDLYVGSGYLDAEDGVALSPGDCPPSVASTSLALSQVNSDDTLCVRTDEGHDARLHVTDVAATASLVIFTYELQPT